MIVSLINHLERNFRQFDPSEKAEILEYHISHMKINCCFQAPVSLFRKKWKPWIEIFDHLSPQKKGDHKISHGQQGKFGCKKSWEKYEPPKLKSWTI